MSSAKRQRLAASPTYVLALDTGGFETRPYTLYPWFAGDGEACW